MIMTTNWRSLFTFLFYLQCISGDRARYLITMRKKTGQLVTLLTGQQSGAAPRLSSFNLSAFPLLKSTVCTVQAQIRSYRFVRLCALSVLLMSPVKHGVQHAASRAECWGANRQRLGCYSVTVEEGKVKRSHSDGERRRLYGVWSMLPCSALWYKCCGAPPASFRIFTKKGKFDLRFIYIITCSDCLPLKYHKNS